MSASIHYDPSALAVLSALEESHFWFAARRRILIDAIGRWFPNAACCLEVGCGTGYNARGIAAAFPAMRLITSDPLDRCADVRLDALHIPFKEQFDLIGCYDVLEHVEDHSAALFQLWSACRPGGGVLLTAPQHPSLWSTADVVAHHQRRYTGRDLRAVVRAAGFRIDACTSFNMLNLPFMYARALALRKLQRLPAARVPIGNWLMGRCMDADRLLIRGGFRLPVGGSLLMAARRPA